jgi:hypothetical protein
MRRLTTRAANMMRWVQSWSSHGIWGCLHLPAVAGMNPHRPLCDFHRWVARSNWNGPVQHCWCQVFLRRSLMTTQLLGWSLWHGPPFDSGKDAFTLWKIDIRTLSAA